MRTESTFRPLGQLRTALLLAVLLIVPFSSMRATAQTDGFDEHIRRLDGWIAQASAEGNAEAVAGLQRDRNTWIQLRNAVEHDDIGTMLALQHAIKNPYPYVPSGVVADAPILEQSSGGPEFMNQVYAMPAAGKYDPLEKHEAKRSSSGGGYGGFGGHTSSLRIPGETSKVRFRQGQHRFVVKVYQGQDPMDIIKLVRFDVRGAKKERYVDLSKSTHAVFHSSSNEVTTNRINIAFKNIGDQVYEVQFDEALPAGEYGFMNHDKVFAFGVDE